MHIHVFTISEFSFYIIDLPFSQNTFKYVSPVQSIHPHVMPTASVTSHKQHDIKLLSWHSIYFIYSL